LTAVGAAVPVIAHHEAIASVDKAWAPVVMAAEFRRHEAIIHEHGVPVHTPVHDANLIAFLGDDALDERLFSG
jgi:hypothetical protein